MLSDISFTDNEDDAFVDDMFDDDLSDTGDSPQQPAAGVVSNSLGGLFGDDDALFQDSFSEEEDDVLLYDDEDGYVVDETADSQQYVGSVNKGVIPFNHKFFVLYLGITPLVLYKENIDELMMQVTRYNNIHQLNKLLLNMVGTMDTRRTDILPAEGFMQHIKKAYNHYVNNQIWSAEEAEVAATVMRTTQANWDKLHEHIVRMNSCRGENTEISPKVDRILREIENNKTNNWKSLTDGFSIVQLLTSKGNPRASGNVTQQLTSDNSKAQYNQHIVERLINAVVTEDNHEFINNIISSYVASVEHAQIQQHMGQPTNEHLKAIALGELNQAKKPDVGLMENGYSRSNYVDMLKVVYPGMTTLDVIDPMKPLPTATETAANSKNYFSRSYTYSSTEYKVLGDLGFPVAMTGNEHLLKREPAVVQQTGRWGGRDMSTVNIGLLATKRTLISRQERYNLRNKQTALFF